MIIDDKTMIRLWMLDLVLARMSIPLPIFHWFKVRSEAKLTTRPAHGLLADGLAIGNTFAEATKGASNVCLEIGRSPTCLSKSTIEDVSSDIGFVKELMVKMVVYDETMTFERSV